MAHQPVGCILPRILCRRMLDTVGMATEGYRLGPVVWSFALPSRMGVLSSRWQLTNGSWRSTGIGWWLCAARWHTKCHVFL